MKAGVLEGVHHKVGTIEHKTRAWNDFSGRWNDKKAKKLEVQNYKPETQHTELPLQLQQGNLTIEANNPDYLYTDGTKHQFLQSGKQLQNKNVVPYHKDSKIQSSNLHMKSRRNDPLFTRVPTLADIKQGGLGDCYLLAALASIVSTAPETIQNMMKDNGDGTVTAKENTAKESDGVFLMELNDFILKMNDVYTT